MDFGNAFDLDNVVVGDNNICRFTTQEMLLNDDFEDTFDLLQMPLYPPIDAVGGALRDRCSLMRARTGGEDGSRGLSPTQLAAAIVDRDGPVFSESPWQRRYRLAV